MQTRGQTVLFVGDLSYADNYKYNDTGVRWDSWSRFIERSAAYQPWIWSAGNHEIEYEPNMVPSQCCFLNFYYSFLFSLLWSFWNYCVSLSTELLEVPCFTFCNFAKLLFLADWLEEGLRDSGTFSLFSPPVYMDMLYMLG